MPHITQDILERFANLSKDYNPAHLDSAFAKDSYFGEQVIYGIYQVFFALEHHCAKKNTKQILQSLSATFLKPIGITSHFSLKLLASTRESIKGRIIEGGGRYNAPNQKAIWHQKTYGIIVKGELMSTIECRFLDSAKIWDMRVAAKRAQKSPATFATTQDQTHLESSAYDNSDLKALFPACAERLDYLSIGILLASTRIVGMKIPGLHSIYSSIFWKREEALESLLDSAIKTNNKPLPIVYTYKTHNLLHLVTITLHSPIKATIKAFERPQKLPNESLAELARYKALKAQPFARQKALVVGAGSGFGNVCAKLLALGGAQVLATTLNTAFDTPMPNITTLPYDVLKPTSSVLKALQAFAPTHLYYFATPKIKAYEGKLNKSSLSMYLEYYLFGLDTILHALSQNKPSVFEPSSCFVEELPLEMKEYSIAKSALETYLRIIAKQYQIPIATPRLPKSATNQTLSILPSKLEQPSRILLDELLRFATQNSTQEKQC